jgi:amidase
MLEPIVGGPLGDAHIEPFTLALLHWYRGLPGDAVERARAHLTQVAREAWDQLGRYDVVLCPTMPMVAPPLGTFAPTLPRELLVERTEALAGYTALHTFAGVPAMSVPLFTNQEGLPIGSQFAAPMGGEAALLELAYQLEEAAPWAARWPTIAVT